jgi:hypothetical protein
MQKNDFMPGGIIFDYLQKVKNSVNLTSYYAS